MSLAITKLLDAKSPEQVKLFCDKIYNFLTTQFSEGSGVARVKRGVITIGVGLLTATETVEAVSMSTAELRFLGQTDINNPIYIELTNSTTITATRTGSASGARAVSYELTG